MNTHRIVRWRDRICLAISKTPVVPPTDEQLADTGQIDGIPALTAEEFEGSAKARLARYARLPAYQQCFRKAKFGGKKPRKILIVNTGEFLHGMREVCDRFGVSTQTAYGMMSGKSPVPNGLQLRWAS
jgi:hypothetical protein